MLSNKQVKPYIYILFNRTHDLNVNGKRRFTSYMIYRNNYL